ncbi:hypothetical protein ABB37_05780 [Leptomonas pyrrhocoris]|uniref:Uncharacterized protein n=1 Tax=Leptomonas pyrrhocoris TaxID=157538 RepID=A0A0N0VEU4_LEPPY|nr:hypothetical protein ABB37_05780 [Leptomonas pyrrhocoris]XP_015657767.1 hypothetical protein ABB37_05780 [Leptomonas pyrrhocoris]KPA79327.1 hypothetical protein ABB37_05780 [Leptomonas pyrrhocoris]KPA79328.1 hypothetical protein ABB37_05780 [Leptomonas pyrrhocoris]|eukprot:XP_015657766.1 hypothetical protein ABB37_05780 [Leptomonas pyrrhocoris]
MSSAAVTTGAPHSPSLYNEQLFYAVLKQGNPSEARVEALAALALRHLPKAAETWAALRKVLMEQSDLDAPPNRTLWYVMDALMKDAPHVFVPLLAPRLLEYTIQQLPWELAGHRGQTRLWFESLVLSWERVLPQRLYSAIRQHAVQSRSGAELHGLLDVAQNGVADDGSLASSAELQRLQDAFDAVRYMGDEAANQIVFEAFSAASMDALVEGTHNSKNSVDSNVGVASASPDTQSKAAASRLSSSSGGLGAPATSTAAVAAEDSLSDKDDYSPDYVEGAQRRELPKLDLPKQKRRREARRRPREDDLGM